MKNDLPIRLQVPERAGGPEDDRRLSECTKGIIHHHWAVLSKAYVAHREFFLEEATRMDPNRAEYLRDRIASLN